MEPVMNDEITSLSIELEELKLRFHESMSNGEPFSQLKKIYSLTKDIELRLNTLQEKLKVKS